MSLPRKTFAGQTATVTMMELRRQPGEVMDRVSHGMVVRVMKRSKHVATIVPASHDSGRLGSDCVVHPDGTIEGEVPLTLRRNLGSGSYGS